MKKIIYFAAVLFSIFLAGCATTKPTVITDFTFHPIPQALLVECESTAPPAKEQYLAADWDGKEKMWVETYKQQNLKRKQCNNQIKQLAVWNKTQAALFEKSKEAQ